jgi:hypothetical protein
MEIKRSGSQPPGKGPADWITGTVRIDPFPAISSTAGTAFLQNQNQNKFSSAGAI